MATTLTISIPAPADARLRQQAGAAGKPLDAYVANLVERAAQQKSLREILGPVHTEVRESGMNENQIDALMQQAVDASRAARKRN